MRKRDNKTRSSSNTRRVPCCVCTHNVPLALSKHTHTHTHTCQFAHFLRWKMTWRRSWVRGSCCLKNESANAPTTRRLLSGDYTHTDSQNGNQIERQDGRTNRRKTVVQKSGSFAGSLPRQLRKAAAVCEGFSRECEREEVVVRAEQWQPSLASSQRYYLKRFAMTLSSLRPLFFFLSRFSAVSRTASKTLPCEWK